MGPAQFGTHRVPNWESFKKCPHVAQVPFVKAFAKHRRLDLVRIQIHTGVEQGLAQPPHPPTRMLEGRT